MELRYAHIADFASADSGGKLTVVGAFDIIWDHLKQRPIPFPPFYLVAGFEASVAEGANHTFAIQLVDDDENPLSPTIEGPLQFRANGVGHPARANTLIGFGPGAVGVPELGDYYFTFAVDGKSAGRLCVSVLAPATKA